MGQKINIYTIYAQEDKVVMDTLLSHLKSLQKEFNDAIWQNDPIATGQPWKPLVESRLEADIVLLLVSDAFMNSDFTTQLEFKTIIERYKTNKSVVIPIIIENCQWAIDFKLWDYEFNLNELPVLPDDAKPIQDWKSLDKAYANVAVGLKKVLDSITKSGNEVEIQKGEKEKVADAQRQEQLEMGFTEEKVAKPSEEIKEGAKEKTAKKKETEPTEEIETKKETEPIVETEEEKENRLWEEAEAKRRSEAANRLKEAAAASAKRRDEEDRLWEEGVAKRKAEKEQRIREAAANPRAHEEQRLTEEAAAKKRSEEAQRRRQVEQKTQKEAAAATAKRKANEESKNREADKLAKQKVEKEQRLLKEVAAKRKAAAEDRAKVAAASATRKPEQKQRAKAKVADKHYSETSNLKKQTNDANDSIISTSSEKKGGMNKKMLLGLLVALIAILAIWTFSKNDSDIEEVDTEPKIESTDGEDSDLIDSPIETTTIDTPKPATTNSKLEVGDSHAGGIVFTIEEDGKSGKIAHTEDAGPISWQDAIKINEQLGEGWRLPSFYELSKMYRTIGQGATNSGQFADELYWSATDYDDYQARLLRFRDGNTSYHYNKNVENRKFLVRAVRDFGQ